ncbi:hypothetical protein F2Q68_00019711 [Brassica cretica]|uniref:F-box associated beta-propeller type 3 domain-containing protein n=1 Tax=Brassica cretica TaxID=69181 RepID=A0A8S9FUN0_BRACR|nr:hypothetical protein F2Q68_00019711 [Brassica cretica]
MESAPSSIINTEARKTLVVDPLTTSSNACAFESPSRFTLLGNVDEVVTEPSSSLSLTRGGDSTTFIQTLSSYKTFVLSSNENLNVTGVKGCSFKLTTENKSKENTIKIDRENEKSGEPSATLGPVNTLSTLVDQQSTPITTLIMESAPSSIINTEARKTLVVDPLTTSSNACAFESPSRFTLLGNVDEVVTEPSSSLSLTRGGDSTTFIQTLSSYKTFVLSSNENLNVTGVKGCSFKLTTENKSKENTIKIDRENEKSGMTLWNFKKAELCLWVLEDVKSQDWSKNIYTVWDDKFITDMPSVYVVGMTASGEIVLTGSYIYRSQPFYVCYFNPERKTLQKVEFRAPEVKKSKKQHNVGSRDRDAGGMMMEAVAREDEDGGV